MANEITLLERQYKLAIDARDKLNENYHKWMTFYYVANAAILVAVTTIVGKNPCDYRIFMFALIGIFICILWNLSCKGYYYWSNSWIHIIIKMERKLTDGDESLFVYSAFSEEVAKGTKNTWYPTNPANISTPKLTLLFSFFSIIVWTFFSIYEFFLLFPALSLYCKIVLSTFLIIMVVGLFCILPNFVKSRKDGLHTLINQIKKPSSSF